MTLTRQHFQLIAETINDLSTDHDGRVTMTKAEVAEHFARALRHTNGQFNAARFVGVATGERLR